MARQRARMPQDRRTPRRGRPAKGSALFARLCASQELPDPVAEYVFARPRRWRFDYAWPESCVALEVEGGVWVRGRHVRPSGFLRDMDKYNAAASLGWLVLRCTPDKLTSRETLDLLTATLGVAS